VRRHWTAHHGLLGLTQIAPIPKDWGWQIFRFAGEPVFFASYQTGWPEVILVKVKIDASHAFKPEFIDATARFLSHPEMWPVEAFLITQTDVASGLWHILCTDAPQEVFETIRFNCGEHVQQLRIIGPKFADQFEQLAELAAPYATKSWTNRGCLWLDFDWPCCGVAAS